MATKTEKSIVISDKTAEGELMDAFLADADEIGKLVKLRTILAFGSLTDVRVRAESELSREITKRVNTLSASLLEMLRGKNEEDSKSEK